MEESAPSTWPPPSRRGKLPSLGGARVAILETRLDRELARLVERYGGTPISAPALREVDTTIDRDLERFVDGLDAKAFDAVLFLTGVSVTRLVEQAERLGRRADLVNALARVTTICRGPKPVAALRAIGITASATAREPFTTAEIIDALTPLHATHRSFAIIHYGERNATLVETLRAREAVVEELVLYEWQLPEDLAPLRDVVARIVSGKVDALVVTCQIQVTHLFAVASETVGRAALVNALNRGIVVAAVGPRCRAALEGQGVRVDVVPEHPKLGPMMAALARQIEESPRKGTKSQ
ncbi:MAG TPA: uroporphyrinogen-III synthase [Labilithrix sp.]|nr:uroporphyrinogen-III synthase [Labilithrix sp.]